MREASWGELFGPPRRPFLEPEEPPREPTGLRVLLSWEDWLTFAIVLVVFLSVVSSINGAHWVKEMPSLYPIALLGLLLGLGLSRLRWPEVLIHPVALLVGAAGVLAQILAVVPGAGARDRFETLVERMDAWFGAALGGGISNDSLPFIIMVVGLTWLAAYASSWSIFRWHNPWLGLIPGGIALLVNISYLPGQFSVAFVFFLFGAVMLLMRMHLVQKAEGWRREGTPYPEFLSLSVLNATFWVSLVLVGAAWAVPLARSTEAFSEVWERISAPIVERVEGLSRVFVSVSSKKPVNIHRLGSTLPFQGSIKLSGRVVLQAEFEGIQLPYLRAQAYEVYTPAGWTQGGRDDRVLDEGELSGAGEGSRLRDEAVVSVHVIDHDDIIFSIGQPLAVDLRAKAEVGPHGSDVAGLRPRDRLGEGDSYVAVGSVSIATEDELRAADSDYPTWVTGRYLQLPEDLPASVRDLAADLTRFAGNPYDKARAIEEYLRTYPVAYDVPGAPVGRDAVDYFLFEARRGYFDYHASAMVVMLRAVGIPARIAVGYVLEDIDREPGTSVFSVRERSAFAWPEVFFPRLGWVDFNPTPSQPLIWRPGSLPMGPQESDLAGGGAGLGNIPAAPGIPMLDMGPGGGAVEPGGSDRGRWVLLGVLAGLAAVLVGGAGGARLAWQRGLAGLDYPARLWEQTVRLASWARLPPAPHQTPREFARSLRERAPELGDADILAEGYVRSRFGRKEIGGQEREELESAWKRLRGRLLRRILRRKAP